MSASPQIDVYLEIGKKKTFAGAIEWPGWSRSGRDETTALQALFDYAPRYAFALEKTQLGFRPVADPVNFVALERLGGNTTTEFGSPAVAPSADFRPVIDDDLQRFKAILEACWGAFDTAVMASEGKELRKGPRGGGRELNQIVSHVQEAEVAYLSRLGWKIKEDGEGDQQAFRKEVLKALEAAAHGELPTQGPRGGSIWGPRYFVRRAAWHVLDHAWEIEDRILKD